MTRYLSGLCVAGLGLCGGGWLIVATAAFGAAGGGSAGKVNLATGAGLMLASCAAIVAWAAAWRRRMRMDGVLGRRFLPVNGHVSNGLAFNGHAFNGRAPSAAAWSAAGRGGAGLAGARLDGYGYGGRRGRHGGGHDGASAADVLGELRTLRALLGPMVATTAHAPVLQARARPPQAAPARPERPERPGRARREAGLLAGDDELLRLADSEEAWW
jgi:hypothetical protein